MGTIVIWASEEKEEEKKRSTEEHQNHKRQLLGRAASPSLAADCAGAEGYTCFSTQDCLIIRATWRARSLWLQLLGGREKKYIISEASTDHILTHRLHSEDISVNFVCFSVILSRVPHHGSRSRSGRQNSAF